MNVTVEIPDDIGQRLREAGSDLSRLTLEALMAEEYRRGHLTESDLRRVLGSETGGRIEGVVPTHEGLNAFEQGLGLFGSPEDAALLDEVVSTAYSERRRPTKPVPAL
jgi:hypothetical protein